MLIDGVPKESVSSAKPTAGSVGGVLAASDGTALTGATTGAAAGSRGGEKGGAAAAVVVSAVAASAEASTEPTAGGVAALGSGGGVSMVGPAVLLASGAIKLGNEVFYPPRACRYIRIYCKN